jgi:P-type Mg2+ transporter
MPDPEPSLKSLPAAPLEGHYWAITAAEVMAGLATQAEGLSAQEALMRLRSAGPNTVQEQRDIAALRLLLRQLASPLVLILLVAAVIALFVRDWVDAATILVIVAGSTMLGFGQEFHASRAVAQLRSRLALNARVIRGGTVLAVPARDLVPGDIIELRAGNLVPADGVILAARDFLVIEASLTGESFPVEKQAGVVAAAAALSERSNCVFLGSSVRSGTATVIVVRTGGATAMGKVAGRLSTLEPEGDFARGVRHFGEMLMRVMLIVVICVLTVNQLLGRPPIESLLFAMALAVGLSPELLPAIVSVSLSRGARSLAAAGVLVRRLEAIEDLGGMDVLCTDKTGTLTLGTMALESATDPFGQVSAEVLKLAYLNAAFETGIDNPIDAAITQAGDQAALSTAGWRKVDEIPYDFVRKRLTIVAAPEDVHGECQIFCKGAFAQVLSICTAVQRGGQNVLLDDALRAQLQDYVSARGAQGVRVLAVASRRVPAKQRYTVQDESDLVFAGFLNFSDPPKPQALQTVQKLASLGIQVKIVTGDNRHVAAHLAGAVGLNSQALLTGEEVAGMRDESLWHLAERTDVFAQVDPAQKERIVRALQRRGHAVGYMGDGINDASALQAADVGISVDQAVDVARESADVVLLRPDLEVLSRGVQEGRRTFANTLKYISITTSANFGNMISMALATPLLPFLPLTATQILLNNFLSDLPSIAISTDRVDSQHLARPQRWNVRETRRFMLVFGLISSLFDLLTFYLLIAVFSASEPLFHSAWFVVSLLTELAVVLVLRTRFAAWQSRPSAVLLWTTAAVVLLAMALPYLGPPAQLLGFVAMPAGLLASLLLIVAAYIGVTEWAKIRFYGHTKSGSAVDTQKSR